jgi:hypothetical protein
MRAQPSTRTRVLQRATPRAPQLIKKGGYQRIGPLSKNTPRPSYGLASWRELRFCHNDALNRPQAARSLQRYLGARSLAACYARPRCAGPRTPHRSTSIERQLTSDRSREPIMLSTEASVRIYRKAVRHRLERCPPSIGTAVRLQSEQLSAIIGIRTDRKLHWSCDPPCWNPTPTRDWRGIAIIA